MNEMSKAALQQSAQPGLQRTSAGNWAHIWATDWSMMSKRCKSLEYIIEVENSRFADLVNGILV